MLGPAPYSIVCQIVHVLFCELLPHTLEMLILVTLILVNFFGFLVITRHHGSFGGRH